jgi:hypothetical protein
MTTKRGRENTSHSVDHLRALGYHVEFVERWIPGDIRSGFCGGPGIKKDLFGIMDLLAVRPGEVLGVQVGSLNGHAAHRVKILGEARTWDWIASGSRLMIHSWDAVAPSGRSLRKWKLTEEEILPDHLGLDVEKIHDAIMERLGWEVTG